MPTPQKNATIQELRTVSETRNWAFVVGYRGLKNSEMESLRRAIGSAEGSVRVVKNALFRIASEGTNLAIAADLLSGPSAIITGAEAPAVAKALMDWAKTSPKLEILGGVLEGTKLAKTDIEAVSQIPPREVLYSLLVAGLEGPISGLAQTLSGIIGKLVYALDEIKEQRSSAA